MTGDLAAPDGADKSAWRQWAIERRRARAESDRSAARLANRNHLFRACRSARTVCAFLPLASEPLDPALLDDLAESAIEVLVPLVRPDRPLDWCRYPTPVTAGAFGIAEPTGPRLGPSAIAAADVVLVPAFAVDRHGHRLGRGGGHYDRSLAEPGLSAQLIAVLFDGEAVDRLPAEPHDVAVTAFVSPGQSVVRIAPAG